MDTLTLETLKPLLTCMEGPCVSLYLPTDPGITHNLVRYKNLLREAETRLARTGLSEADLCKFMRPADRLEEEGDFWAHPEAGMAVFLSANHFRAYRLPVPFPETVALAEEFLIRPLLPLLTDGARFLILALSHNDVRLIEATRDSAFSVEIEGMPKSLAEAMRFDEGERQLQFHSTRRGGPAMYHGHGADREDEKEQLLRFFRQVDRALHSRLREERVPLLLAGVDYLLPIYREANTYPHLMDLGVFGNPDRLRAEELQCRAWPLVQPLFETARQEAFDRYHRLMGTGLATNHIEEILPAVCAGRVETLFVAPSGSLWGCYAPGSNQVTPHPAPQDGDTELVNYAAIQAILHGGTLYASAPNGTLGAPPIAALLRY